LKKEFLCFADFEFTCGGFIDDTRSEILSVGLVICSPEYEIAEKFYSTARPCKFPRMTRQCRELTGLTQPEINASRDSNEVFAEVAELLKKYSVSSLYVWGNFDRPGLAGDMNQHRRTGKDFSSIKKIYNCIADIQDATIKQMGLPQAVSISELSAVFGYEPQSGSFHNALSDAEALYTIHRAAFTSDLSKNEKFLQLKQERLDKIAAVKAAAEEKRREEALALPLTAEEQAYCNELSSAGKEDKQRQFIAIRAKFVRALLKAPECEDFVLAEFSQPKRIKVFRAEKFGGAARHASSRHVPFKRSEFADILLNECKKSRL